MNYVWVFVIGYLLGCFPSAVVFSRLFKNDDVRKYGSGNPGASNTFRVFGIGLGGLVMIADILKGVLAALIGSWILGLAGMYYGGLMAVVGHNWPITLKFKGGKGVATSFGMALVIMPVWSIAVALVFAVVLLISRYASLGSLVATICLWVITLLQYAGNTTLFLAVTLLTVMIFWRHRTNIDRLLKGSESKLNI
jgi:glycerol-3-phosphate acyltransferase PlsY